MAISRDGAELLALRVLGWMAEDPEIMGGFLGATGAGVGDLRARATDRAFQVAVLDHLLMRDDWVLAFAEAVGCAPDQPLAARMALGGAEGTPWG
ncbi:hypothetical protein CCR83_02435 [Rhodobacter veldkampii DSM 11550]|uniref:DUF3572 domain-containing protein n=1 Tax=Phaeovulum veldkampii DSM 11550 TaxID=1185920 RepID=A0A2T4JMH4_9RHOB|nr:DUF3572 domain-containing protein [Phaeovulum veldkampii]MBK5945334.1 hypothetical protein [Phaeovulum veldkampii DSM 11550]NCU20054.1 DUF3572 family protein [Candidatus Falkowbacteria bacterium]PTE19078.1 DUF3572 domain-containing protein [Phaeovulum veldkampii DSM 11550]TDQ61368.1 uncharacterized protein DUF3572 [Phaeovulum veldkampii DSM 11550]